MKKEVVKKSFISSLPVMAGYLFLGAGFGVILSGEGYGIFWALLMSITMLSGTGQYIMPGLMASGAPLLTVAMTIFSLNARYLFYGISMVDKYKHAGWKKPYLIFGLTDETYSLICERPVDVNPEDYLDFCFLVSLFDQCYWILGSVLGVVIGTLFAGLLEGVDFIFTALFITVFTEQCFKTNNHLAQIIGIASTFVCLVIFGSESFLIPSMIVILILLLAFSKVLHKEVNVND